MKDLDIKVSLIKFMVKVTCALYVPNVILQEALSETVDQVAEMYLDKQDVREKEIQRMVDYATSSEVLAERNVPESKRAYIEAEVKKLLGEVPITTELVAHCKGDSRALANALVKSYQELCTKYPLEDSSHIKGVLITLLPRLVDYLANSPSFLYDGLISLHNVTDELKKEIDQLKCLLSVEVEEYPVFISDRPFDLIESFIGRTDLVKTTMQAIVAQESVTLFGIGGIGKTEIAKAVVRAIEHQPCKDHGIVKIAWVEYDNQNIFYSIARAFRETRGIEDMEAAWSKAYTTLQKLRNQLLIVIDNVETIEEDKNMLRLADMPCRILLTSRVKKISSIRPIQVKQMQVNDCVDLFKAYYTRVPAPQYMIKNIIRLADQHTVTIELLAKLAQLEELSLEGFYQKLVDLGFRLSEEKVAGHHQKLQKEEKIITQLAKLFSLHHLCDEEIQLLIPVSVIPSMYFDFQQAQTWFDQSDRTYLRKLVNAGWLQFSEYEGLGHYVMHSVTAAAVRYQYQKELYSRCKAFIASLTKELQYGDNEFVGNKKELVQFSWSISDLLQGHLQEESDGDFLFFSARIFKDICNYQMAMEFLRQSIRIYKTQRAKNTRKLAHAYNLFGLVYNDLCHRRQALTQYKAALRQKNATVIYAEELPVIVNIAIVHMALEGAARHGKAYGYLNKALEMSINQYGENDPHTLDIKFLLANCIAASDNVSAHQIFEDIIKAEELLLPANDPRLAEKYRGFGNFLYEVGDYQAATEMFEKALTIYEDELDKHHPIVADIKNSLGLLNYQLDINKAQKYFQEYLDVATDIYGDQNPVTAVAHNNVGLCLFSMDRFDDALEKFQVAERILRDFGEYLPEDMGGFLGNQGQCLAELGRGEEAIEHYKRALQEYEKDPNACVDGIAKNYGYMGSTYFNLGKKDEAYDSFKNAIRIILETWGDEYVFLASIYNNYALVLEEDEAYVEAIEKLEAAKRILLSTYQEPTENLRVVEEHLQRIRRKAGLG